MLRRHSWDNGIFTVPPVADELINDLKYVISLEGNCNTGGGVYPALALSIKPDVSGRLEE